MQRVPALATPALRHPTLVEHDVITSGVGKQAAHGQPGVSRANNDGVDDHHEEGFGSCGRGTSR